MSDYDIIVVGCGASAYGFLKGLEKNALYKNHKIAIICPLKYLNNTNHTLSFKGSPKFLQNENSLTASYWENSLSNNLKLNNFSVVGVHGIGGMARIWGSSYGVFDKQAILKNDLNYKEFIEAYKECEKFLPLSGNSLDDLKSYFSPLGTTTSIKVSSRIEKLYGNYLNNKLLIGYPRLMVYTKGDNYCNLCNQCLIGCERDSIWYPKYSDFNNIKLDIKIITSYVEGIKKDRDSWHLLLSDDNKIKTTKVVLASGAIQNYKLLSTLNEKKFSADIYTTPAVAFGFLNFKPINDLDFFGMGNASFLMKDENDNPFFYGNLYDGYSLSISKGLLFSKNKIVDNIFKFLVKNVIAGAGFMSSDFSKCEIQNDDNGITINGNISNLYNKKVNLIKQYLKKYGKTNAGKLISFKKVPLGADIHYGGGIPKNFYSKEMAINGKLNGLKGIYVVGGSTFQYLPPVSQTFSFITNSYRIGKNF